jgi:redox-sensitive bicupin YhaK (pirin superfamily)
MTAGSGVVHSEMPEEEFARKGGRAHGFQLWVNLPRKDKMIRPRYQEIPREGIPVANSPDGQASVRVIAGESLGKKAVIDTRIPITYLHVFLKPGGQLEQPLPPGSEAFAYVVKGEGVFGKEQVRATEHQMVIFEQRDAPVVANAPEGGAGCEFLLIAGTPLHEPVVRYGPFVMNTEEEIHEAIDDYRNGRMGIIRPA